MATCTTDLIVNEKEDDSNNGALELKYDTLLDRFSANVRQFPNKLAIAFLSSSTTKIERQFTYNELDTQTTFIAQRLRSHYGVQPDDRVVLVYPPSLDFMMSFIACCKANVIAVPVFPPNPSRKDSIHMFSKIVNECRAKYALTSQQYNYHKKMSTIKESVAKFQKTKNNSDIAWPEHIQWIVTDSAMKNIGASSSSKKNNNKDDGDKDPNPIQFLQFTSGSTSDPKGVMITRNNLGHNLSMITNELQADENTIVVSWLPQYHDMGLIGSYLGILYCGGTGYYMSPISFLSNPSLWIEAISLYQATHLQAPNFAFKLTSKKFDPTLYTFRSEKNDDHNNNSKATSRDKKKMTLNLSSVRHVINAAEPIDEESLCVFYQTFTPFGFKHGVIYPTYGLAEHTVFVCSGGKQIISVQKQKLELEGIVEIIDNGETTTTNTMTNTTRLVGCGYPSHQNVDVRIVKEVSTKFTNSSNNNEDDTHVPEYMCVEEDVVGEIWINSPSKAAGYYHKETETRHDFYATITTGTDDDSTTTDQYLRTGDLGFYHNSELFICGRLKDLIIIGGRNYYPQDIEATAEYTLGDGTVRYGCTAAFTISPVLNNHHHDPVNTSGTSTEQVALVMELRAVQKTGIENKMYCEPLADQVRAAINREHSLGISVIIFVRPKTIPKTSSGKIARSWCRKAYVNQSLQIIFSKSTGTFEPQMQPLEIEPGAAVDPDAIQTNTRLTSTETRTNRVNSKLSANEMRALPKDEIQSRITNDIAELASIPNPSEMNSKVALSSLMDSITLAQFKGMLENNYHVRTFSDEYLLRDTTTITKLVEIVKLGYAPDDGKDGDTNDNPGSSTGGHNSGGGRGLAGVLGCPPGVACAIQ